MQHQQKQLKNDYHNPLWDTTKTSSSSSRHSQKHSDADADADIVYHRGRQLAMEESLAVQWHIGDAALTYNPATSEFTFYFEHGVGMNNDIYVHVFSQLGGPHLDTPNQACPTRNQPVRDEGSLLQVQSSSSSSEPIVPWILPVDSYQTVLEMSPTSVMSFVHFSLTSALLEAEHVFAPLPNDEGDDKYLASFCIKYGLIHRNYMVDGQITEELFNFRELGVDVFLDWTASMRIHFEFKPADDISSLERATNDGFSFDKDSPKNQEEEYSEEEDDDADADADDQDLDQDTPSASTVEDESATVASKEPTVEAVECPWPKRSFTTLIELTVEAVGQHEDEEEHSPLEYEPMMDVMCPHEEVAFSEEFSRLYNHWTTHHCDRYFRRVHKLSFLKPNPAAAAALHPQEEEEAAIQQRGSSSGTGGRHLLVELHLPLDLDNTTSSTTSSSASSQEEVEVARSNIATIVIGVEGTCRNCPKTDDSGAFPILEKVLHRRGLRLRQLHERILEAQEEEDEDDAKSDCICAEGTSPTEPSAPTAETFLLILKYGLARLRDTCADETLFKSFHVHSLSSFQGPVGTDTIMVAAGGDTGASFICQQPDESQEHASSSSGATTTSSNSDPSFSSTGTSGGGGGGGGGAFHFADLPNTMDNSPSGGDGTSLGIILAVLIVLFALVITIIVVFVLLRRRQRHQVPNSVAQRAHTSWISDATWALVAKRAALRHLPDHSRAEFRQLSRQMRQSINADRKHRAENVGNATEADLTAGDLQSVWGRLRAWYHQAIGWAPRPTHQDLQQMATTEQKPPNTSSPIHSSSPSETQDEPISSSSSDRVIDWHDSDCHESDGPLDITLDVSMISRDGYPMPL
jgi:hypothetical protein